MIKTKTPRHWGGHTPSKPIDAYLSVEQQERWAY